MFTNVAVQVHTNILTAVVCHAIILVKVWSMYIGLVLYPLLLTNYYQFCPISGIHTSYRGGGGGLGYPPKA